MGSVLIAAVACKSTPSGPVAASGPVAVVVVTAPVETRTVPIELDAIGHVEASSTVSLTSQVDGTLEKVLFKEGDEIKKDQLLFTVEAQPFRAALAQAQAQVAKDRALTTQAQLDSQRADSLAQEGLAPAQDKERASSNSAAVAANLNADQAALEAARIRLAHTEIRSPIDGRAGSLLVHAGNVVHQNAPDPLVVLRCVKPVLVQFTLPEDYLPQIRERMSHGGVQVSVTPRGTASAPLQGALSFIDNTVDTGTGTIGLKASLPNLDEALWPGQQVDVRVNLGDELGALAVPEAAVQAGQQGPFAYAISDQNTADLRQLTVKRTVDHFMIIGSGLKAGERVAVDGLVRLTPGASVKISAGNAPAASSDSPAAAPSATLGNP
ncbi:MAG TPA: efflux RND transporter periplasmic adaptor subunit [Polyangiaceae bacterium]|nr:efflux RND transporter periplasmic adaptor subunit [Polyangiaceae bacterium]